MEIQSTEEPREAMQSRSTQETGRSDTTRPSRLSSFPWGVFGSSSAEAGSTSASAIEARASNPEQNVLRVFTFNDLSTATRDFGRDNLLGRGGFGIVFLGWIEEHRTAPAEPETGLPVAVKVLHPTRLLNQRKTWLAKVKYIWNLRHPNLVKLLGYCSEGHDRVLVYEYMDLGSLQHNLFARSLYLSWSLRLKIASDVAKGLAYLHDRMIIFGHLKTSNILLDSEYNAKLSDFGLATKRPHEASRVMGNLGYLAPEYSLTEPLTPSSDVYAFGVVLLELVSGKQAFDTNRTRGKESLAELARPCLAAERDMDIILVDPVLGSEFSPDGALGALYLAGRCLCQDPKTRPTMQHVVTILAQLKDFTDTAYYALLAQPRDRSRVLAGL